MRRYGFPEKELWLTELSSIRDAIEFWGINSEIAEIIHQSNDPLFVLYYHESGTLYCAYPFSTDEEFEEGCRKMAQYFNELEL